MKVELLVLGHCAARTSARAFLQECLAAVGSDAELVEIQIDTPEQARRRAFPGSPTVRVNGTDVEPGFRPVAPTMASRTYRGGDGLHPLPDRAWVLEALRKAQDADAPTCCAPGPTPEERAICPGCGTAGRRVKPVTLRALLRPALRAQVREEGYRFCGDPDCDVVYCSADRSQIFRKADLIVRVGLKEREAPRPLCYCFGHSVESIEAEWRATGRTTALEVIRSQMQTSGCRCEVTNPVGTCCLGDVAKAVKAIAGQVVRAAEEVPMSTRSDCCSDCCPPSPSRTTLQSAGASTPTPAELPERFPVVPDWTTVAAPAAREALTGILTAGWHEKRFDALDAIAARVLATLLRLYADQGAPPSLHQLAAAAGLSSDDVRRGLIVLREHDLVLQDKDGGTISGAYPFTERATGHAVTFLRPAPVTLKTMCIIDALGAGAMCRERTLVHSICRACGAPLAVRVDNGGLTLGSVDPPTAVVWAGFKASCGCAATSLCTEMIGFCSDGHLEQWKTSTLPSDGRRLSVEEAFQVGKALFADRALRGRE